MSVVRTFFACSRQPDQEQGATETPKMVLSDVQKQPATRMASMPPIPDAHRRQMEVFDRTQIVWIEGYSEEFLRTFLSF
jgi:hypothetical protein